MLNMSSSRESLSKIVRELIDQTLCSEKKCKGLFYHEFRQLKVQSRKRFKSKMYSVFHIKIRRWGGSMSHTLDTRPIRIEISEMKINWLADLADRTTVIVVADLFIEQLKFS